MEHIAIDLGGKESQVCCRLPDGQLLEERKLVTSLLGKFLRGRPPSRVVLETCSEAFAVADEALALGHEVRVVPATLVRSLGVGSRGIKTDVRDTRILSEVSCRIDWPSVHVPSDLARERRAMVTARDQVVSSRTALINSVRGWMRTVLLKVRSGAPQTFSTRVRLAAATHPQGLPVYIEPLLVMVEGLSEQIAAADKDFRELAKEDPICQKLMSLPGVGPTTSMIATVAVARKLAGVLFAMWRDGTTYQPQNASRQAEPTVDLN